MLGCGLCRLGADNIELLIVSHDEFTDAVQSLAQWKQRKGINTRVVSVADRIRAEPLRDTIRKYQPANVILVGDRYHLPLGKFYSNWTLHQPGTWTDHYYADTTDDDEYKDDIIIGRLPCSTAVRCSVMVNKIIAYEQANLKTGDWYIRATGIARDLETPHYDSCYRHAIRTVSEILLDDNFLSVDTLFRSLSADSLKVEDSISLGRGFVIYRGAALYTKDNWGNPFNVSPARIDNDSMPALVVSPTCRTMYCPPDSELRTALGYRFLNEGAIDNPKGAVSFWGTTTHYYGPGAFADQQTYWRNAAGIRFVQAMTQDAEFVLGKIIAKAKDSAFACCSLSTYGQTGSVSACSVAYMEWNLLGDPTLHIWTAIPKLLTVDFDTIIPIGLQVCSVRVFENSNPVNNALVCLMMDTVVYKHSYTNSAGIVSFSINPLDSGRMFLTATARNCKPFIDDVAVKYRHDVAAQEIIQPVDTIDSIGYIIPKVKVYNYGFNTETFNVQFRIDDNRWMSIKAVNDLVPDEERIVSFDTWFIEPRGMYLVKCSTELVSDNNRLNDKLENILAVRVKDYAVSSIIAPVDYIDSTANITPQVWIHNFGSTDEDSVHVIFLINGTSYTDTVPVSLNTGDSSLVSFQPAVNNYPRGIYEVRCWTQLIGDCVPDNNLRLDTFSVRVRDFGAGLITQPVSSVDSSVVIVPKVWIHNLGTTDETNVAVRFSIVPFYSSTRYIALSHGDSLEVVFDSFALNVMQGIYTMKCTTQLSGDLVDSNNSVNSQVVIVIPGRDYAVIAITAPPANIDTLASVIPKAVIYNLGQVDEDSIEVVLSIDGTAYQDTQYVSLNSGQGVIQNFSVFTANYPRGIYTVRCTTRMNGDTFPLNNLAMDSFTVQVHDYQVSQIIAPQNILDSSMVVVPKAKVYNRGSSAELNVPVIFYLNAANYANTKLVSLNAGDSLEVIFDTISLCLPRGIYPLQCSSHLSTDNITSNDAVNDSFAIKVKDVGVSRITFPIDDINYGDTIVPQAWICNYGSTNEINIPVVFHIQGSAYSSIRLVSLLAGDSVEQSFDEYFVNLPQAIYQMSCSTGLFGDLVAGNNRSTVSIHVFVRGWVKLRDMTFLPDRKRIKDGAALTVNNGVIYAFQGGNTQYFYACYTETDSWIKKCSIPFTVKDNRVIKRRVKTGGALTAQNDTIYAFKGGNSTELWMYLTKHDTWQQQNPIPEYATGSIRKKKVKTGASIAFADSLLYAFKGGNTNEFWAYNVNQDTWLERKPLVTESGKKIKAGGTLVAVNDTIYALIGGNTPDFYMYYPDTWTKRHNAQFGSVKTWKKNIKGGAAMTVQNRKIYAFKGGNTKDFAYYDIEADTWVTLDTLTGHEKVKAGAALVSVEPSIYGFIGGNTNEFWRYTPTALLKVESQNKNQVQQSVMSENVSTIDNFTWLEVWPNPVKNVMHIEYLLSRAGHTIIKIYNIDGRMVKTAVNRFQNRGRYEIELSCAELSKGIYFVRYGLEHSFTEHKVIIQ